MNMIGPLANPAGVRRQVLGVADRERAVLMADALARLGVEHAMVVHGRVGMDEISPQGVTDVWEVRGSTVTLWEIDPAAHGCAIADVTLLRGGLPADNARRIEGLLGGANDGDAAGRAASLLNAGAALYVAGLAPTYAAGVTRAGAALDSGAGQVALERLRRSSASTSG